MAKSQLRAKISQFSTDFTSLKFKTEIYCHPTNLRLICGRAPVNFGRKFYRNITMQIILIFGRKFYKNMLMQMITIFNYLYSARNN